MLLEKRVDKLLHKLFVFMVVCKTLKIKRSKKVTSMIRSFKARRAY